jgi:hypothetical protein
VIATIPVDELKIGQTLATPVHTLKGEVLLGAGAVLDKRNLRLLKAWGVTGASVLDRALGEVELNESFDLPAEEEARIERVFASVLHHPQMKGLYELARRACARRRNAPPR